MAPRARRLFRLSACIIAGLVFAPLSAAASPIYAITVGNAAVQSLFSFDSATPGTLVVGGAILGLQSGETLVGIDFRPATGQLYGVGSTSRLYTIDTATRMATEVGSAGAFALFGTAFDLEFIPTTDRIRITSDAGQNLRLNPNNGALAVTDTPLSYAAGDLNAGVAPRVVGSAYTNSVSGSLTTTLYDIDSSLDTLATQIPNLGVLNTVGALGFNTSDLVGFDILTVGSTNTAFAMLTPAVSGMGQLFTIDLATGAVTLVGTVGGNLLIADIAAKPVAAAAPEPAALLLMGAGLLAAARRRRLTSTRRRRPARSAAA